MVDRSLCMREAPGSIPRFSKVFSSLLKPVFMVFMLQAINCLASHWVVRPSIMLKAGLTILYQMSWARNLDQFLSTATDLLSALLNFYPHSFRILIVSTVHLLSAPSGMSVYTAVP